MVQGDTLQDALQVAAHKLFLFRQLLDFNANFLSEAVGLKRAIDASASGRLV